ncbi:MAG: hypothetical protein AMS22_02710 [Thiotrichales bacterium SG8_50]|nr:MAG: hypothetical protein AMS22_02710 [Thiotrichales bacterium SG8_50]
MKSIAVVLLTLTVLGCQSAPGSYPGREDVPAYYAIPVGSELVLNRAITVAGNTVSVFLQDGKLLAKGERDQYRPNCKFELYTMSAQARTVEPDTFMITRLVMEDDAGIGTGFSVFAGGSLGMGGDSPSMTDYRTVMYLRSERQRDVSRLSCQHWEDPTVAEHLRLAQIRQALGEIMTLTIAR